MTLTFWLIALLLCVIASGFVLIPLFLRQGAADRQSQEDREQINIDLYREQESELEAQRVEGAITEDEFVQLRTELQLGLLADNRGESGLPAARRPIGKLPMVMAVLIPLVAVLAYSDFGLSRGSLGDLEVSQALKADGTRDPKKMRETVERLARSLEDQPDNHEGLFMLAQSWLGLAEYEKAAAIFSQLAGIYTGDAGLASYTAESLFLADGRNITPRVDAAIDRTLKLNPHDVTMLEIRAMDAFTRGDLQTSRDFFRRALTTVDGKRAELIRQAIARIDQELGTPVEIDQAGMTIPGKQTAEVPGRVLQVLVEKSGRINAPSEASVFVFARAANGPPMPLAVQRLTVNDLPTLVKLDENMAMIKGMGLADFDRVQIVARISSSGIANASPEDYEARSAVIDLTDAVPVVKLVIEKKIADLP